MFKNKATIMFDQDHLDCKILSYSDSVRCQIIMLDKLEWGDQSSSSEGGAESAVLGLTQKREER